MVLSKSAKVLAASLFVSAACLGTCYASSMTYTPVNPDFGGSPFNAAGLLAEANAQNHFQAPTPAVNNAQNFSDTITAAVLGQISSSVASQIFASTGPNNGTLTEGNTKLTFTKNPDGTVTIGLTDLTTGQQTTLTGITGGSR